MDALRSRRALAAAAVTAVFAFSGAGHAAPAVAATTLPTIGALRICSDCASTGGDLSRYHYAILNSWDAARIPALKAANPGLKVLVYKSLSFTVSYECHGGLDDRYLSTGVGYCDASAAPWFLQDTLGARINSSEFSQEWLMDVGDPLYQERWLANVTADLRANGWDGVFMDDTNTSMGWHLGSRTIAKYPTDTAWRAATRSMLARVGPSLTSAGFLSVSNLYAPWAANYDAQATWRDWIQFTSGAAQEYYSKWGTASSSWFANGDWTFRQQFQAITEQAGKIFLGITYAPKSDARSMVWARANFLLFDEPANGGALVYQFSDPEAQDPYSASWAADVGSPVGQLFQTGSAWRRNFSGGTVVVNPTTSTLTVALGKPYLTAGGSTTSSVTLGPTSGAILSATGEPGVPAPPGATTIVLQATVSGTSVKLSWSGMSSAGADVFHNGARLATVANTGGYVDRLSRKAKGTFAYKVCAAGTSVCSQSRSVKVGSTSAAARTALAAGSHRALRELILEARRGLLLRRARAAHHLPRR